MSWQWTGIVWLWEPTQWLQAWSRRGYHWLYIQTIANCTIGCSSSWVKFILPEFGCWCNFQKYVLKLSINHVCGLLKLKVMKRPSVTYVLWRHQQLYTRSHLDPRNPSFQRCLQKTFRCLIWSIHAWSSLHLTERPLQAWLNMGEKLRSRKGGNIGKHH